ncbi:hypothetical protein PUNSTDRAFT_76358, partial [Punctularia strigosozonata HHB-11173 SS5]
MIDGEIVNRVSLERWLRRLPDVSDAILKRLLNSADHQNVPRATEGLSRVVEIGTLDLGKLVTSPLLTPQDFTEHRAFIILGRLCKSFLEAFTSPSLCLTEQLANLSRLQHINFALYRKYGSAYISPQLYSDLCALGKSAFFVVAQQKLLDDSQSVYLYQLGSDRLEELFGEVRTSTHDSNYDILQLSHELSGSAALVEVYNRNPDLNRGHRRLKFGLDHVNPRFFTGDLTACNANLTTAWNSGRIQAL